MTDQPGDVDPDALREDIDAIKHAMGLEERYAGVSTLWVVFGVLVAVAAGSSQLVHAHRLPLAYHSAIWLAVLGGGGYLGARGVFGSVRPGDWTRDDPDVFAQFVAIYLATVPIQVTVSPFLATGDYVAVSSTVFGLNLVLVGVALVVMTNSLKAYRIRRPDRLALYAGGLWMLVLGAVVPHSAFLREWGYATYGGLYLCYAVATYAVLAGGAAGGESTDSKEGDDA